MKILSNLMKSLPNYIKKIAKTIVMMLGHPVPCPCSTKLQAEEGPNTICLRLYAVAAID